MVLPGGLQVDGVGSAWTLAAASFVVASGVCLQLGQAMGLPLS